MKGNPDVFGVRITQYEYYYTCADMIPYMSTITYLL